MFTVLFLTSSLTLSWFVFIKLQVCHIQSCRLHTAQLQEGLGHSYQPRQLSQAGELGLQLAFPYREQTLQFQLLAGPSSVSCSVSVLQTYTCLFLDCLLCSLGQQALVAFIYMFMSYFPVQMKYIK